MITFELETHLGVKYIQHLSVTGEEMHKDNDYRIVFLPPTLLGCSPHGTFSDTQQERRDSDGFDATPTSVYLGW